MVRQIQILAMFFDALLSYSDKTLHVPRVLCFSVEVHTFQLILLTAFLFSVFLISIKKQIFCFCDETTKPTPC